MSAYPTNREPPVTISTFEPLRKKAARSPDLESVITCESTETRHQLTSGRELASVNAF
ncbi:MAG: hypothetical protein RL261_2271 [Pseudomonadota bacterium]|jgi:hypothetical protein